MKSFGARCKNGLGGGVTTGLVWESTCVRYYGPAKRFYQLRRRFCIPRPVRERAHVSAIMFGTQPASIPDFDWVPVQCGHDLMNALVDAGLALAERNTKDVAQACSRYGLHARLVIDVDRALQTLDSGKKNGSMGA